MFLGVLGAIAVIILIIVILFGIYLKRDSARSKFVQEALDKLHLRGEQPYGTDREDNDRRRR